MSLVYSIDTSSLISAWNSWYRPDNHPDFWDALSGLGNEKRLLVSDQVLEELKEGGADSPLYLWLKNRETHLCVPSNRAVQKEQQRLVRTYHRMGFGVNNVPSGKDYADPFVVAVACIRGALVITDETMRRRPESKIRIPEVCRLEGLRARPIHAIIREEGWRFRRAGTL